MDDVAFSRRNSPVNCSRNLKTWFIDKQRTHQTQFSLNNIMQMPEIENGLIWKSVDYLLWLKCQKCIKLNDIFKNLNKYLYLTRLTAFPPTTLCTTNKSFFLHETVSCIHLIYHSKCFMKQMSYKLLSQ